MNQHRPRNPERQTFAVTYIRLIEVNPGKLAALDVLAPIFLSLCQQYVTLFCTDEYPDKFHPLSLQRPFLNAGTESPFNKQQALPNPGAPTARKPTRTMWTNS